MSTQKLKKKPKAESIQMGDFAIIDYVAKVKETGKIFDTTIEAEARKGGVYNEEEIYAPKLIILGENWYFKTLEIALVGLQVGQTKTIELKPQETFGKRDPKKVETHSIQKFQARRRELVRGARVRMGNRTGTILRVGQGRVIVDFNPPLAGRNIIYKVTINQKLKTETQKVQNLLRRRTGPKVVDKFKLNKKAREIEIIVPQEAFLAEGLQLAKSGIAIDFFKHFPRIKTVKFSEIHQKPTTAPPEKPKKKPKAQKQKVKTTQSKKIKTVTRTKKTDKKSKKTK